MKPKMTTDSLDENVLLVSALFSECLKNMGFMFNGFSQKMYLDSSDLMRFLNISESTLYRLRKKKIIPTVKIGNKLYCPTLFFTNLLEDAVDSLQAKRNHPPSSLPKQKKGRQGGQGNEVTR